MKLVLSPNAKKAANAVILGFITGAGTAMQIALSSGLTGKKAFLSAGFGILMAGLARATGAFLAWLQTDHAVGAPAVSLHGPQKDG